VDPRASLDDVQKRKFLTLPELELRPLGRPARSQSLYRLRSEVKVKIKAILVTGRGSPWVCETSRLPHFLDNRLTDGGEVVSFTRRPAAFYPQEDSWYSFLLEAEPTPRP
jgi:hypothetical protein